MNFIIEEWILCGIHQAGKLRVLKSLLCPVKPSMLLFIFDNSLFILELPYASHWVKCVAEMWFLSQRGAVLKISGDDRQG